MNHSLEQQVYARSNDYSRLGVIYHRVTGVELVRDLYGSVRHPVPELSLSVVMSMRNAREMAGQYFIVIELSDFKRKSRKVL